MIAKCKQLTSFHIFPYRLNEFPAVPLLHGCRVKYFNIKIRMVNNMHKEQDENSAFGLRKKYKSSAFYRQAWQVLHVDRYYR